MSDQPIVYVVDGDDEVRSSLAVLFESEGIPVQAFATAEKFLTMVKPGSSGCLILEACLPGMDGLQLQTELQHRGIGLPVIFLAAEKSIPLAVKSIQAGAIDFLTKPVDAVHLLDRVRFMLRCNRKAWENEAKSLILRERLASLSPREKEVLSLALAGNTNKEIARLLGISCRTVENHRARILLKTDSYSLLMLASTLASDLKGYQDERIQPAPDTDRRIH